MAEGKDPPPPERKDVKQTAPSIVRQAPTPERTVAPAAAPPPHARRRWISLRKQWITFRRNANSFLALFTAALVIATIVSNWILIHDQRAANVASLRPYLIYDTPKLDIAGPTAINVYLNYHNAGKTPAFNAIGRFVFSVTRPGAKRALHDRVDKVVAELQGLSIPQSHDWAVGPGAPKRNAYIGMPSSPGEMRRIKTPGGWVLVGEVTYTDTFQEKSVSEICIYGTGGKIQNYFYCPSHNGMK